MESGAGIANERLAVALKDPSCFGQFRNGSNPWMARYVYGLIFLFSNLLAWAARDYGRGASVTLEKLKVCAGKSDCSGAEGVLRVSLGCFIFYIIMFLSTVGTSKLHGRRDAWHSGWWTAKIALWISLTIITFLVPSAFFQIYGEIAHFGAGVFLLIQLISVISFIRWLNDCCQSEKNAARCKDLRMLKVNAGFLTPGLMGLYVVFLCWCAIRSEPAGESCNRKAEASRRTDWLTIISFIVALLAIVIATFSTGIDSQCFQFRKGDTQDEDDVPYGLWLFPLCFCHRSNVFCDAIDWLEYSSHHSEVCCLISKTYPPFVHLVFSSILMWLQVWMLVAPILLKIRRTAEPV
ncbi:serine incorporator [Populus alba x Populus x berolinensis]|uniref:Serine incorporator n=1 Tax=Populus alba x Populus x berolinensis TaxID=444605 RepID=A0AAD6PQP1_9ROSI|nr:serine incorporator [Populus alba x Populus x berolinensis]